MQAVLFDLRITAIESNQLPNLYFILFCMQLFSYIFTGYLNEFPGPYTLVVLSDVDVKAIKIILDDTCVIRQSANSFSHGIYIFIWSSPDVIQF